MPASVSAPSSPPRPRLPKTFWLYLTAFLIALPLLTTCGAFEDYTSRMSPVLGFVVAMALVVDRAEHAGVLRSAVTALRRLFHWDSSPIFAWLSIVLLAVMVTIFFSLDTTAIVITPVALLIGKEVGFRPERIAVCLIWIANLASSVLVVSNLTTLLAQRTGLIDATHLLLPGLTLAGIAVLASTILLFRRSSSATRVEDTTRPGFRTKALGGVLIALMIALLIITPVWIPAAVAAAVMWVISGAGSLRHILLHVIPWNALALVLAATSWATLAFHLGALDWLMECLSGHDSWVFMVTAALGANVLNNLPAYLVLEPAAGSATDLLGVLIGVNAGCLLTPWASLASLLILEQTRLRGVHLSWKRILIPSAGLMALALGITGLVFLL